MSAALRPEDFDNFDDDADYDPDLDGGEGSDNGQEASNVSPQDVLAMYQAMYNKNQTSQAVPGMLSVAELSRDQVRLAYQICHELTQVENRLGVTVTNDNWNPTVNRTLAGIYRATMLSIALSNAGRVEKQMFWKVGTIVMSIVAVVMTVIAIAH